MPDSGLAEVARVWEADFQPNVVSAVLFMHALLTACAIRRPSGERQLYNRSRGEGGSYSAGKAALLGWTFDLAADLGPGGITVNVVVPGYVAGTEFFGDTRSSRSTAARCSGAEITPRLGYVAARPALVG